MESELPKRAVAGGREAAREGCREREGVENKGGMMGGSNIPPRATHARGPIMHWTRVLTFQT